MDRLLLPLGQADFRTIRENGSYYVDKTGHIGQIIRDSASSILFTRPRRFGKTTFQSMLKAFFDIREDNRDIFTGLAIMDDEEAVLLQCDGMDEHTDPRPLQVIQLS